MAEGQNVVRCWRCGTALDPAMLPLRREEVCPACDADLHVCKLCRFFNMRVSDGCDEPMAGGVGNKERANFCDYFEPGGATNAHAPDTAGARARSELEALFGGASSATPSTDADANRTELERLFGLRDE